MTQSEDPMATLQRLRGSIDNIDATLVYLLAERFKCTKQVGELKAEHGMPPSDPAREEQQLARLRELAHRRRTRPRVRAEVVHLRGRRSHPPSRRSGGDDRAPSSIQACPTNCASAPSSNRRIAAPSHVLAAKAQPAHLLVRPERLGQDLRARRRCSSRCCCTRSCPSSSSIRTPTSSGSARCTDDAPAAEAAELATRDIRVFRSPGDGGEPLHAQFLQMPVRSRAAILQVDPLNDAEDFNAMLRLETELLAMQPSGRIPESFSHGHLVAFLKESENPVRRRLAMRLENLGVADWDLWAWGAPQRHRRHRRAAGCDGGRPRRLPHAGRVAGRRARRARSPVGEPRAAHRAAHRDRRGAQPVHSRSHHARAAAAHRADRADRRRGPQVRALAAALDAAPVEGASERAVPVRQPRPDADELPARPRRAG